MIRIFDYIFYRTYIAYMKRNDPAGFVSPLYVKGYKTADSKPFLFIEGSAPILL